VNYSYQFTLGLSSVDAAGVLFYPELLRHAHDAYEGFMAHIDWALPDILTRGELLIPVVHVDADYLRPLRHGTQVSVTVTVGGMGDTSFTIDCDFIAGGDTPCARVRSVHVCIDAAQHSPVPVPAGLREQLEPYLNH
jgi:1,4-dihydroxy-2-naphthoyl-CoA hydrolase